MGHVPVNKNTKQKWIIMGVIIVIILIVGCVTGLAIKRKPIQNAEDSMSAEDNMSKQTVLSVEISIEREKEFIEFEKLFREQQDDLKKLAEELVNSLEKKSYVILFDEEWYSGNYGEFLVFLYIDNAFKSEENEDIVEILNKNSALKETLNSIIENGVIIYIDAAMWGDMWVLEFLVDSKFTPFITGNNGVENAFHYCEDEGLDKYGYQKKVEDNWYLWISPPPE